MIPRFINFIKKPTSYHIVINTIGNYLNVFFTAFFALILVRIMTPSQYGVLSVLLGIAYVLANVLDFGTSATIYSYLPPMIETKAANLYRFLKSTFFYQTFFSLIVIAILFLTFPYLDKIFFKTGAPSWELYLTTFSVLFLLWQNYALNSLFAAKRFAYTITYFVASQFFNIGLRMDLFLLSFFRSKAEVGYYGLSQKIILTLVASITSITQVLSPAFSRIKTKKEVWSHLKTGFLYLLIPAALFFILFFTPTKIFTLFFTDKFAATAAITKSLSLPYILYALSNLPVLFILYTVKKPSLILVTNIIFFVIMTVGCYLLIPINGVFAPSIVIFAAVYLSTFYLVFSAILEFKKMKNNS